MLFLLLILFVDFDGDKMLQYFSRKKWPLSTGYALVAL